ncbi:hypothetical protein AV540_25735, partial [Brevibacillus parabrevis]|uniref:RHS repeat-associated core domain-containing protein n=1 Tax=Brevibacillus parabrevis TaxID=54914 RepID=UPI0007ABB3E4
GEMYDKESGFYYLRARYYDPKMGRFISEDTYKGQVDNPLSLNRYTYTHNNPLRFVDPTGHAPTIDDNTVDLSAVKSNTPQIKIYVTGEQMNQLGFKNVNDNMVQHLNQTLNKFEINTPERIRHFLAQVMVESDLGRATVEYGPDSYFNKYDGRTDLGNTLPGDGPKYRGAGYIQLTGKANYQQFADFMGDQKIVQEGYSYVSKNYAWESAGYFWGKRSFNALIDEGATVKQVTFRVNGGYNHLAERMKYYSLARKIIK